MRWKEVLPVLAAGLCLTCLATADKPGDKPAAPDIAKLVEQLGSDTFAERQAASKKLDAIGAAALPALEKASKSSEVELRKRATELYAKISLRTRSAEVLTPTEIELKFKDTPIKEAIAAFEKKAKTSFNLIDPEGKLKDKKVTLDTGKVPFWVALEKFCEAAGLDEADPSRVPMVPFPGGGMVGAPPGVGFPAPPLPPGVGGVAPAFPGGKKLTDEEIKKLKETAEAAAREAEKAARKLKEEAIRREKEEAEKRAKELKEKGGVGLPAKPALAIAVAVAADEKGAPDKPVADKPAVGKPGAPAVGAPAIALPLVIAVPPLPPMAGGPAFGGGVFPPMMGGMPGINPFQHGKINLIAGKLAKRPTDAKTSVRVRTAPDTGGRPFAFADGKSLLVQLQAAPEPRLRLQGITSFTIDKAVDDNDQNLSKYDPPAPMGGGGIGVGGGPVLIFPGGGIGMPGFPGMMGSYSPDGINHNFQVMLKKGEKASKKLKELSGTLTATFLSEAKPHIVADNLMKAAGKTFKGGKGGAITINKVATDADGVVRIEFEFDQPEDIMPEHQVPGFGGGGAVDLPAVMPPVRIRPGRKPGVRPVPPVPAPAPAPADPAADKPVAAPAKKAVAKAEVKVAVAFAVAGGPAVGAPAVGFAVPGGPGIGMAMPAIGIWDGGMGFAQGGLTLQDAKGNVIGTQIHPDFMGGRLGGAVGAKPKFTWIATYKAGKGQPKEPAKLVFTGRTSFEITVPFKLEDVPVAK
ncbi:MAG: hypothetical protein K2W96_11955 [Gemmataceae bacterium]|nr:hypothetical protein [Gemmataceae bacterium]